MSVRPSVCLSHVGILSKRLNVSSDFSPSGTHTILVFPYQTDGNTPTGTPLPRTGASNARGYEKITIFDQYIALSKKIEPYLLWKADRKPHPSFRMVPVLITFSDVHNPDFKVTIIQRQTRMALGSGRVHVPPTKVFPRLAVNKTILKPRLAAATGAQYVGCSRRNKIPRCSAYDIGESNPVPASGL